MDVGSMPIPKSIEELLKIHTFLLVLEWQISQSGESKYLVRIFTHEDQMREITDQQLRIWTIFKK